MDKLYEQSETGCCLRFNPEPWDGKEITFQDKLFIKDSVRTIFHVPFGFGRVMVKNMGKIIEAGALAPEPLLLYHDRSLWKADVYIAVAKEVPGAKMEKLSGTFLTKVFEGPYSHARKWVKEMKAYVKAKGKEPKKLYFFYTTCPRCAKVYGKNYTVLLAAV